MDLSRPGNSVGQTVSFGSPSVRLRVRSTVKWGCVGALSSLLLLAQLTAPAAQFRAGELLVTDVWSRPTPPVSGVAAVYFSITNSSSRADRLIAVSTPLAQKAEIHESHVEHGVMEMRPVTSVECPPGATVTSAPGGMHVMLSGLAHPLIAGSVFPLMLRFRDAGVLTVQVSVESRE